MDEPIGFTGSSFVLSTCLCNVRIGRARDKVSCNKFNCKGLII